MPGGDLSLYAGEIVRLLTPLSPATPSPAPFPERTANNS